MTESWAPEPLSPEEMKAWQKEIETASETDPPELMPSPLQDEPEKAPEPAADDAKAKADAESSAAAERDEKSRFKAKEGEPEKAAAEPENKADAEPPKEKAEKAPAEKKRPPWWDQIPKEAQQYIDNTVASRTAARNARRDFEAETKRRDIEHERIVKEQIAAALKASRPVPDPQLDPEAYQQHQAAELKALKDKAAAQEQETAKEKQDRDTINDLVEHVGAQEIDYAEDHEDYYPAIAWAKEEYSRRIQEQDGVPKAKADQQVLRMILSESHRVRSLEGNVPHRLYRIAQDMGWGKTAGAPQAKAAPAAKDKTDGEKTAEAIAAGAAAAKTLGKGTPATAGGLTLEQISNIKDPEEHAKAYAAWVAAAVGESSNWH